MDYKKVKVDYDHLMLLSVSGDKSAFYNIVKDWKEPIINFFYQNIQNIEISEDLTQELFISIWKLKKYQAKGYFSAWIYRIARNKLVDFYRKKQILTEHIDDVFLSGIHDNKAGIEEIILQRESSNQVRDVLELLPEEEKNILILSQLHGKNLNEISEIMDCSLNSIKGKIFRAIKKFVKKFKELETNGT